jgi:hypothetical protein
MMTALRDRFQLDGIPSALHEEVWEALQAGNVAALPLCVAYDLGIIANNREVFTAAGIYEPAFLEAFTGAEVNHSDWPLATLDVFFRCCDRDRLRAAGDPLPGPGPFTLYRGIAGCGPRRRPRGFSWTADFERAKWFATRLELLDIGNPAVLQVTVDEDAVLAYVNERKEQEFVVALPPAVQPGRVWPEARRRSRRPCREG